MEQLPDDVLLLIFEHVNASELLGVHARVCRRWARLAERRVLHVRGRDDLRRVHAGLSALLVTASVHSLAEPLALARRLRELTVHALVPLGDTELAALRRLPHLAHLDVFTRSRLVDGRMLPALERLSSLVLNETVAPGVLRALSSSPRLRALHMFGRALYYPRRELRALLGARRDHLRELTLRCTELHDAAYKAIGSCANLTSLQLYSCWMLTAGAAHHVARPTRLRRLHLTGARMLRSRALSALLHVLPPTLEELSLSASWFADTHAGALATRLPGLRALELWRCRVTAPGVTELALTLPALRELDLDVPLGARHVVALGAHPVLRSLRCMPAAGTALPPSVGEMRVLAADARFPRGYLRGGSEGLRADLFYFWTQGVELDLPPEPPPAPEHAPDSDAALLAKAAEVTTTTTTTDYYLV